MERWKDKQRQQTGANYIKHAIERDGAKSRTKKTTRRFKIKLESTSVFFSFEYVRSLARLLFILSN